MYNHKTVATLTLRRNLRVRRRGPCVSLIAGIDVPVNRETRSMSATRKHRHQVAAAIVLIALLAPLAPLMAWHCDEGMLSEDDCADHTPRRCAGLWSAACCDFSSPPRPTNHVPGGADADPTGAPVGIVEAFSTPPSVFRAPRTLDLLLEDRAGPLPPRLLTSVLLI